MPSARNAIWCRVSRKTDFKYEQSILCSPHHLPSIWSTLAARPQKPFEFPDGFNCNSGVERFKATELLFQPRSYLTKVSNWTHSPHWTSADHNTNPGIAWYRGSVWLHIHSTTNWCQSWYSPADLQQYLQLWHRSSPTLVQQCCCDRRKHPVPWICWATQLWAAWTGSRCKLI